MKEKILFLNVTAHNLIQNQVEKAKERFKITDFTDIKADYPELFQKLSNLKIDSNIDELCYELFTYINNYTTFYDVIYVHMPCGSPFFQAKFFYDFLQRVEFNGNIKFVFSFSERKVIENEINGKVEKKVVFEFIDFHVLE